nr:unnamed protein product [Digitaria exilis]
MTGAAAAGAEGGEGEELFLLSAVEAGNGGVGGAPAAAEDSWRLNFEGLRPPEAHQERPPTGALHHCLGVLAQRPEDVVAEYYQQQVEMLEGFNEMDTLTDRGFLPGMSKEEREKVARSETLAIRLSNIANMVLFAAKVYASVRSGSLAIIASTLDSLLDLLSGFILWFTAFSMQTPNPYRYPIGKKRMQPLLAIYTIRTWSMTVLENVHSLVGQSASPEYLQKLTYLCWNHHKAVRHIDTVRAYTFGSHYFVEVDIVLPSDMPLQEAHDIGEALQEKLERLPEIERAFVHLDYEFTHRPEHAMSHEK